MIFNFRISGEEAQIVEFEKELLDILNRVMGNEDMIAHEVHFCIHEAILNIIQHTYKWNLSLPLEVKINIIGSKEKDNRKLEVTIKDSGPTINNPLVPPESLDKFQIRKRGLYMISKIMDEFRVDPLEGAGNITFMSKELSHKEDELIDVNN
jgi:anti-sigma regulatory factor (Ser/Thr protein kinase)